MNKLLITVASLAVAAAPLAASAQSFDHNGGGSNHASGGQRQAFQSRGNDRGRDYGRGDFGRGRGWNDNNGSAVAAGLAGLFLGAALSNSRAYDAQSYAYGQDYGCGWRTQAFRDWNGRIEYRDVNTCG